MGAQLLSNLQQLSRSNKIVPTITGKEGKDSSAKPKESNLGRSLAMMQMAQEAARSSRPPQTRFKYSNNV